jgi:hypothetical protein
VTVFLISLLLAPGQGREPEAGNAPTFVLETSSGQDFRGPLVQVLDRWTVRLGGARRVRRGGDEWLTLRRTGVPLPAFPGAAHLVLTNGDRLPVAAPSLGLAGERLSFRNPVLAKGETARLSVSAVSALWLGAPDDVADAERFRRRLLSERRRHDVVVLRNGDVLEGVLAQLDREWLRIEVARRNVAVDLPKVAAVAFSSELATALRPRGTYARLVLADGTRLSLGSAVCEDGETLTGKAVFGADVRVPLGRVVALDLQQGPAVYLSDLRPLRYEHTPYLGVAWPLVADGSVAGHDLRLAGGVYDRGLGTHSASRVTYAVPAGCRRFEALVGLDDRTGKKGSVRVRVLVDGKERDLGLDSDLTHRAGPVRVRVEVDGAKELTLAVDFGAGGDVGDHVNWADARFVK